MTVNIPHAHCHRCPLAREGTPVPPRPSLRRTRLIVVSDTPGKRDESTRTTLSGHGGMLLKTELARVGVAWEDCHLTNAVLCRPESDKDADKAAECCAPRLLREVDEVRAGAPHAPMLLLGRAPVRSILAVKKSAYARGFVWRVPHTDVKARRIVEVEATLTKAGKPRKVRPVALESAKETLKRDTGEARNAIEGATAIATLGLDFVLKADAWVNVFRRDLARVGRAVRGTLEGANLDEGGPPDAIGDLSVLEMLGSRVSLDIETDGIDPRSCAILCIGLTDIDSGKTCVVWPWRDEYAMNFAAWASRRERIVLHNGFNFDLLVLRNHGVVW